MLTRPALRRTLVPQSALRAHTSRSHNHRVRPSRIHPHISVVPGERLPVELRRWHVWLHSVRGSRTSFSTCRFLSNAREMVRALILPSHSAAISACVFSPCSFGKLSELVPIRDFVWLCDGGDSTLPGSLRSQAAASATSHCAATELEHFQPLRFLFIPSSSIA